MSRRVVPCGLIWSYADSIFWSDCDKKSEVWRSLYRAYVVPALPQFMWLNTESDDLIPLRSFSFSLSLLLVPNSEWQIFIPRLSLPLNLPSAALRHSFDRIVVSHVPLFISNLIPHPSRLLPIMIGERSWEDVGTGPFSWEGVA